MAKVRRDKSRVRWLARKEGVDFGPFTTEQLITMIRDREVDLGSMVCNAADRRWEPLGSHAEFRTEYAAAEQGWASEEAAQHERHLRTRRLVTGGAWQVGLIGVVLVLIFGGWMTWRLSRAEPTGILLAVKVAQPPALPAMAVAGEPAPLVIPEGVRVRRLREGINYDTSGVGTEGQAGPGLITKMSFGGEGNELSDAQLNKVVGAARGKLLGCAQAAANRSERFTGTRVSFVVRSGQLGSFTVGSQVSGDLPFKACVKQALRSVSVPAFGGSERKVTIPLSIKR